MSESRSSPSEARNAVFTVWPLLAAALFFAAAQFAYACHLNKLYYSLHAPFYDSVSYLEQLYESWSYTRTEGLGAGLQQALRGTTALPFVLVPLVSWVVEPSRELAIAYQSLWVLALYMAAALHLRRLPGATPVMCALLPLFFTAGTGFWFYNGGISDFRMDLLFYLGFGLCVFRFLDARASGSRADWIIFGAVSGLVCLSRATAPVFLVLTFAPMLVLSWISGRMDMASLRRAALWAPLACLVVCAWFYVLNWRHLHHYYFVWNTDANAALPLSQSALHFRFAWRMLGWPMTLAGASLPLLALARRGVVAQGVGTWSFVRRLDWALVFPALVPAGFLAARGAGLNPFVAMPSAFGFALLFVFVSRAWAFTGWRAAVAGLAVLCATFWSAKSGVAAHREAPGDNNQIAGYAEAWRLLRDAGGRFPEGRIRSAHLGIAYYSHTALLNWLTYEQRVPRGGPIASADGRDYVLKDKYTGWAAAATAVDWAALPGASLDKKEAALAALLSAEVDVLFVPDAATTEFFAKSIWFNFTNTRVRTLQERLLAQGVWEQTSGTFSISPRETFRVWVNRSRLR